MTYDEIKKWAWDSANEIHQNKITPDELLRKTQELTQTHGNSRHFADAVVEALIAYHEYLTHEIDDTSAQMRLRYGGDSYVKYLNGDDLNAS